MEITSDLLINAGSGIALGTVSGWLLKKAMKVAFKIAIVIGVFYIASLAYLQNIKVIAINQQALDNLVQEGYSQVNKFIGVECNGENMQQLQNNAGEIINSECLEKITVPFTDILQNLGIPLTTGFGLGFVLGWMRG